MINEFKFLKSNTKRYKSILDYSPIEIPYELVSETDIEWYLSGWLDAARSKPLRPIGHFHWQRNWMSYSWGYENYYSESINPKPYFT
jgi:hypothetical protein